MVATRRAFAGGRHARAGALLVACSLLACGETGGEPAGPPAPPAPRPDVVLLVSLDTLRADALGFLGSARFTSPVLDGFAAEGVVFEDASSTAPWTLPAHASMLTGLHPTRHGALTTRTALARDVPTLASLLGAAGWETAAVVSVVWLQRDTFGVTRDFRHYRSIEVPPHRRAPSKDVTDQVITWLTDLGDEGGGLFVFAHYFDVHGDYKAMPAYERLFVTPYDGPADGTSQQLMRANLSQKQIDMCRERFDPAICRFGAGPTPLTLDENMEKLRFDADDVRHLRELYDAGVRQLDAELGRLFSFLQESGLAERTLVIVTSDHGEEFMEHGNVAHYLTQYQEVLRVPLVVRGPGVPAGVRVDAPVSLVDLVPTVLAAVGQPAPDGLDGLDLAALWRGADDAPFRSRYLYGEASGGLTHRLIVEDVIPVRRSVRRGHWKLQHESIGDAVALYDLRADPLEQVDVAAEHPETAAALTAELEQRYGSAGEGPASDPVRLSPEEAEQLRALGYAPD